MDVIIFGLQTSYNLWAPQAEPTTAFLNSGSVLGKEFQSHPGRGWFYDVSSGRSPPPS